MFHSLLAFIQYLALVFSPDSLVYQMTVGSYTNEGNPGIEVFEVDPATGRANKLYSRPNSNASYLATTSDRTFLYAVSELENGSLLTAYRLDAQGEYRKLNSQPTLGDAPCFVSIREASNTVYTANYHGGSLSVFKTENGSLLPIAQHIKYKGTSVNKARQGASHAHNVILSPDQGHLYVTDLGADKIYQHRINADGLVDENYKAIAVSPGNGPRHMIFNKDGSRAYLMNEMKGVIDVFNVSNDQFTKLQTVVADTTRARIDRGSADIHLSPNGRWLIGSNRVTNNDLAIFSVQADGKLKAAGHQPVAKRPRNFSFTPDGKFVFVASQEENRIQVFAFNDNTGQLSDTRQDITVQMPVCIDFRPMQKETDPEARLKALNIQLIPPTSPIANYVKAVEAGKLVFLSGHGPDKPGGGNVTGKLGKDMTLAEGQEAARLTAISLLSTLKETIGDLGRVKRVVKVLGLVNCDPSFTQQPQVMNGCSDLLVQVFGERGRHARTSVGTNALPNNIAIEIEMVVELK